MARGVEQWVSPAIRELSAYSVPDASGLIKLDAMENPYPWPEPLVERWLATLREVRLNRYPDPAARRLADTLRRVMGIPEAAAVLLGNGSDELIQTIALTLSGGSRTMVTPEPGFVMYRMIATFAGMKYVGVPLREGFSLDLPAMLDAIERHQPAVTFIAYPNNPTGNLFDARHIRRIIEASPGVVVLDEAYHAFAGASFMDHLPEYPNLLVMRTLSKLGLAGLRLGILAGDPEWIRELDKVRLPYNINVLTQSSAEFALRNHEVLDAQTARIRADRERVQAEMGAIPGVTVFPSQANFVLFRVGRGEGDRVFRGLLEQGILIKNLGGGGGALRDCLRVTIGTERENRAFLDALRRVCAAGV
ncbi:MAG TPA: histidinol-phosphate transaminase [Gammaproteobacteria bacterium]|nr:histidinol-phosphate transaminase [Gammaproteobacteria bacterium]